jgi:hypothetical protein
MLLIFNDFTDYLVEIDDKDTLKKIGQLNSLGQRVRLRSVRFPQVHKIVQEKYEETNNEKYLEFDRKYMGFAKLIMFLSVFLFIAYVFYEILYYT